MLESFPETSSLVRSFASKLGQVTVPVSGAVGVSEPAFDREAASLDAAFKGVDRLLIVSTDALDRPGHRYEQHQRAIDAAVRVGVKHVVYTSVVRSHEADNPMTLAVDHRLTESALEKSGLGYTAVRNNWYAENLLGDVAYALQAGTLATASGEGKVGWVTRADCARAAASALASDFQGKRTLDVTGPQAVTMAEVAQILSSVKGKAVAFAPVPAAVRKGILEQAGLPGFVAEVLVNAEEAMEKGWLAVAPGDVESLTGAKPTSLEEFFKTSL